MEIELGWLEVEQSSQRIRLGHDDKVIELACNLFRRFFLFLLYRMLSAYSKILQTTTSKAQILEY